MVIHIVEQGETLESIANIYGVNDIFLASDNEISFITPLAIGQTIVVRFPRQTHRVIKGDTLYSIANEYGVTTDSLYRANLILKGSDMIYPGQELVIRFADTPTYNLKTGGYAYPFIRSELLNTVLPFMNYVMPFTYGFNSDGSLNYLNDESIISSTENYGTEPYMHLSTLSADGRFNNDAAILLLDSRSLWVKLTDNILSLIKEKGYKGLDIDFEYLPKTSAEQYFDFLRYVTERLNSESYRVITALAPKTFDDQQGLLYEAHDYAEIGNAVNAVLLMTYEWGYTYGEPQAVSPIPNIREVIEYALTRIPKEKIFIGISNYGYDWMLPYIEGETMAKSLSTQEAFALAAQTGSTIHFDAVAQAPYFSYYDANGAEHIVWFEDARSIKAKIDLAAEYDLFGILYWNLMRKNPQNLTVLDSLVDLEI